MPKSLIYFVIELIPTPKLPYIHPAHEPRPLQFVPQNLDLILAVPLVTQEYLGTVLLWFWEFEENEPRHEKTCLREFLDQVYSNWPAQL